jgi:hypothetical protein
MADSPIISTGSVAFGTGVNSLKTPTVASVRNPDGLAPSDLAWLSNGTIRDGAISPRDPWQRQGNVNSALGGLTIPGTPGQIINQPSIPPINTPTLQYNALVTAITIPPVGQDVVATLSEPYIGNVGDTTRFAGIAGSPVGDFVVVAINGNALTLQTTQSGVVGMTFPSGDYIFGLHSLGPAIPQQPIVIPPGPSTFIANPAWVQGWFNYDPRGVPSPFSPNGTPYAVALISGQVIFIDPDFNQQPQNLSNTFGVSMSPTSKKAYFAQAENYLVIQDGTYNPSTGQGNLPLFWDGNNLRQSNGITGILEAGQPNPTVYQVTTTTEVHLMATGGAVSLPVTLGAPYPGTLYDNVQIAATTGSLAVTGIFRVTQINGNNIELTTLSLPGGTTDLPTGQYTFTLTLAGIAPGLTEPVAVGASAWTVPAVGRSVTLQLVEPYFGNIGDTVEAYETPALIGTFIVTGFNGAGSLTLKTVASTLVGSLVSGGVLSITVIAIRAMAPFSQQDDGQFHAFVVPAVGSTEVLYWPRDSSSYPGKLYDNVLLTSGLYGVIGVFRVVAINAVQASFRYDVTLEALALAAAPGTSLANFDPVLTLVQPTPLTQNVILDGGWIVPPVGSNTAAGLYLYWNYQTGDPNNLTGPSASPSPMYPGSIGDNVTLMLGPNTVGTFTVQAMSDDGAITLQTVASQNINDTYPAGVNYSLTINSVASVTGTNVNEIPSATVMCYYEDILWYAQGDVVSGGDIVGGPSGTPANNFLDSVIHVTENPLALGGDGFKLPGQFGNITGMAPQASLNASLGQGLLMIFTLTGVCSLQVPPTRQAWISANANNPPQLLVVQLANGATSDWCLTPVNGDIWYNSSEPGIRSLVQAVRYFVQGSWGNQSLSSNIDRLLQFVDATLLSWISGVYFNNRLLMTSLPQQTPYGVVHNAIAPLDFTPISTLEEQSPPNWEGMNEGLQIFQLLTGTFNGLQRCFALTLSANPNVPAGSVDVWENTPKLQFENGDQRIEWYVEFPSFTWEKEFDLKELLGGELWVDDIQGIVDIIVQYRPDSSACPVDWTAIQVCSARNSCENLRNPVCYPLTPLNSGYRQTLVFPKPATTVAPEMGRPANRLYQCQPLLTIKGQCRVRGLILHGQKLERALYSGLNSGGQS